MKRIFFAIILAVITLAMFGCGDGSSPPPNVVAPPIISDQNFDGYITKPVTGPFFIAQGFTERLFAGIDPVTGEESRAFLDFPLNGVIPVNAGIFSATLDFFVNSFRSTSSTIPMRIELVSFPPLLQPADYDSVPLVAAPIRFQVFQSDAGSGIPVRVDVTPLMEEAQRLALANFQVRILEDFGPVTPGLIEINDTTGPNRGALAPLLDVIYF